MPVKNQRCQPDASARKLNAAPVLYASTRLKNGSTTVSSPGRNIARIACLVARSSTITATASHSQRQRVRSVGALEVGDRLIASRECARLAAAEQIRDAARAQRRMRAHRAPTSARQCQQRSHFACVLGVTSIASASPRCDARRRRDDHEAQVVAERGECRVLRLGRGRSRPRPAATSRSCPAAQRSPAPSAPPRARRGSASHFAISASAPGDRGDACRARCARRSSDRPDAGCATPPRR